MGRKDKSQSVRLDRWPRIVFYRPSRRPWRLLKENHEWVRRENGRIADFRSFDSADRFRDSLDR